MKPMDLLEALTDIRDEDLTDAVQLPKLRPRRSLRYLAAACLCVVLVMTAWMVTVAVNQDTTLHWTVRYREQCVTYLYKVQASWGNAMPVYEPTVLPDGYELDRIMESPELRQRTLVYRSTRDPRNYISLTQRQITGRDTQRLYTLPLGSYERYDVTIGTMPGQLYLYTDQRTGGELVWLDVENCLVFHLRFDEADATAPLEMAKSMTQKN